MEKLKLLVSFHSKPLKTNLTRNGVESIHYIYLKHHPMRVDIQSGSNIMDYYFVTTFNCHVELMQQQMKSGRKLLHESRAYA
jgi:hypothetical protein